MKVGTCGPTEKCPTGCGSMQPLGCHRWPPTPTARGARRAIVYDGGTCGEWHPPEGRRCLNCDFSLSRDDDDSIPTRTAPGGIFRCSLVVGSRKVDDGLRAGMFTCDAWSWEGYTPDNSGAGDDDDDS